MGANNVAGEQLLAYFQRIERLDEEIQNINEDKKEVFAEAKGNGFNTKVMKIVLQKRRMDHADRMEQEALVELYMSAVGMAAAPRDEDEDEPHVQVQARAHVENIEEFDPETGEILPSSTAARKDVHPVGNQIGGAAKSGERKPQNASPVGIAGTQAPPVETIPGNGAGGAEDEASVAAVRAPSSAQPIQAETPNDNRFRNNVATPPRADTPVPEAAEPEAMGLTSPVASVSGDEGTVLPAAALVATPSNVTTLRTHNPATHFLNSTGLVRLHGCLKPELCGAAEPRKKLCFVCSVPHEGSSSQAEGGAA